MSRPFFAVIALAAGIALSSGAAAADEPRPTYVPIAQPVAPVRSTGFFTAFLAPRMDARLSDQRAIMAASFAGRDANPWMRDADATERVEKSAIRATKQALKRYAMDRLNVDGWSLPLVRGRARGLDAFKTDSGGTRLRFGISHLAPRAEVLVPMAAGRFSFSADALGRIGTSFENTQRTVRLGTYLDPREKSASFGLTFGF